MKSCELPDHMLKLMKASDRKELHLQTSDEAQAAFVAKSETQIHKQIAGLLTIRGIWFCHSRTDRPTTQRKGVPDFLCVVDGSPLAMEVKFGKGTLRPEQEQTRDAMVKNGWNWQLIRSLEEARMVLDNHKEGARG